VIAITFRLSANGVREREGEHSYSPAEVASVEVVPVSGNPDPERICTSIVERQDLTMRMQIRRLTWLTWLTSAFSKKGGEPLGCRLPALRVL
jgi:hypothetical protein